MNYDRTPKDYSFNGIIYLPNQSPLEIRGEFHHNSNSTIDGRMNYSTDGRQIIQGNLINAQNFNVPGSENNPQNFLLFAHFSANLTNHHYFLAKEGNEFEGRYVGKMDNKDGKVMGIDSIIYAENIRYAEITLQDKETHPVEIEISIKR